MDSFDPTGLDGLIQELDTAALSQQLAVAHVANGTDPLDAVLQAQLDTQLMGPFLS